jgi:hypothetical protein
LTPIPEPREKDVMMKDGTVKVMELVFLQQYKFILSKNCTGTKFVSGYLSTEWELYQISGLYESENSLAKLYTVYCITYNLCDYPAIRYVISSRTWQASLPVPQQGDQEYFLVSHFDSTGSVLSVEKLMELRETVVLANFHMPSDFYF